MKSKTKKLSLSKFKIANVSISNSLFGGTNGGDRPTITQTSMNGDPTQPPTILSTDPACQ